MEFQHRLYELRKAAGLSQEELAALLSVSRQAVQKWESGTSRPDMDNLTSLAEYFNVTLDYLVSGKTAAPPSAAAVTTVIHNHYEFRRYEYKSKRTLFGLPLLHINIAPRGICCAKGIIAIGNVACGLVSAGALSVGLLSLGAVSLGLLALGALTLGLVSAGAVAAGLLAWGGVALGYFSCGGVSIGMYACGGVAIASQIAIGDVASAPLAIGRRAEGLQAIQTPFAAEAVRSAISASGAPGWVGSLLQFFCDWL